MMFALSSQERSDKINRFTRSRLYSKFLGLCTVQSLPQKKKKNRILQTSKVQKNVQYLHKVKRWIGE